MLKKKRDGPTNQRTDNGWTGRLAHTTSQFLIELHFATKNRLQTKVDSFQILSVFNTQKSFKISLQQMFILKLTNLGKNICNYLMFPGADFC